MLLEGFELGDEFGGYFGAGGGAGGEAGHYCCSDAFDIAVGGVVDALLHAQAAVRDAGDGCDSLKRFVEVGGRVEVAVDVDDGYRDAADFDFCRGGSCEVFRFGKVEEGEIDGVVDMAEDVDVVEAYLQGDAVAELTVGCRYFGIFTFGKIDYHVDGIRN